jgi:hypothetical protein
MNNTIEVKDLKASLDRVAPAMLAAGEAALA